MQNQIIQNQKIKRINSFFNDYPHLTTGWLREEKSIFDDQSWFLYPIEALLLKNET